MRISIVIPVWNGASIIIECLASVFQNSGEKLFEVICVENASQDESASLIAQHYPQVKLLRQPVNLGFAGGVNLGIDAAQGDVFVLLNQDCYVKPGWLDHLADAMQAHPQWAVAGCTLYLADGSIAHAGAYIVHPSAEGAHVFEIEDRQPHPVEYVTGAVFAIRRPAWEKIGRFDDGFYPAYYEESDFCYRARKLGFEIGYVPDAEVIHLLSSREAHRYPLRHRTNHNRARYRFVIKHFSENELQAFFDHERTVLATVDSIEVIARTLAIREIVRCLSEILERRQRDLAVEPDSARFRMVHVNLVQLLSQALNAARQLRLGDLAVYAALPHFSLSSAPGDQPDSTKEDVSLTRYVAEIESLRRKLLELRQQEYALMSRYYFYPIPEGNPSESLMYRLWRLFVLRPFSFLSGRSQRLQGELDVVRLARRDALQDLIERSLQLSDSFSLKLGQNQNAIGVTQRMYLLELLLNYEYL
jgi:GT2 family glycosyltransferase